MKGLAGLSVHGGALHIEDPAGLETFCVHYEFEGHPICYEHVHL